MSSSRAKGLNSPTSVPSPSTVDTFPLFFFCDDHLQIPALHLIFIIIIIIIIVIIIIIIIINFLVVLKIIYLKKTSLGYIRLQLICS